MYAVRLGWEEDITEFPNIFFNDPVLNFGKCFKLYLFLSGYNKRENLHCFSPGFIAKHLGCCERTVKKDLKHLEKNEYIECFPTKNKMGGDAPRAIFVKLRLEKKRNLVSVSFKKDISPDEFNSIVMHGFEDGDYLDMEHKPNDFKVGKNCTPDGYQVGKNCPHIYYDSISILHRSDKYSPESSFDKNVKKESMLPPPAANIVNSDSQISWDKEAVELTNLWNTTANIKKKAPETTGAIQSLCLFLVELSKTGLYLNDIKAAIENYDYALGVNFKQYQYSLANFLGLKVGTHCLKPKYGDFLEGIFDRDQFATYWAKGEQKGGGVGDGKQGGNDAVEAAKQEAIKLFDRVASIGRGGKLGQIGERWLDILRALPDKELTILNCNSSFRNGAICQIRDVILQMSKGET